MLTAIQFRVFHAPALHLQKQRVKTNYTFTLRTVWV